MKFKKYHGYVLSFFLLFTGLSCSRQEESPLPLPSSFNKSTYLKRAEVAFFSDSALKELRILRNEIYAKHGRIFESKDLRDYFGKCDWYHPTKKYSDNMLSKSETEMVRRIEACETYLRKMNDKDRRRLDSVKVFYKSDQHFDTTIVDFIDYTGDGKKEKCITGISRKGDSVAVHHVIIDGKNTIYDKTELASFAPDKELVPTFEVYNNLKTTIKLSPFKASLQSVSPDLKKHYEGKKAYKKYLAKFKGDILLNVTGESAGCSYFWYAPEKRFETLYCE
jgi:hypothetical protein